MQYWDEGALETYLELNLKASTTVPRPLLLLCSLQTYMITF